VVDKREWTDTYEPAFQACIVEAQASGLMCSYNALNGLPSTCACECRARPRGRCPISTFLHCTDWSSALVQPARTRPCSRRWLGRTWASKGTSPAVRITKVIAPPATAL
jgi:hypothetical protein